LVYIRETTFNHPDSVQILTQVEGSFVCKSGIGKSSDAIIGELKCIMLSRCKNPVAQIITGKKN
jgi:hypothetical protein